MGLLDDKELNEFRDLVLPPSHYEEGFTWRTVLGTLFVALVMLPAALYMNLMVGGLSLGPAARWVTIILFLEMAKRARSFLRPAEIYILFIMIGMLVGNTPADGFLWRQYLVQSDAAVSFGLADKFPSWWAPSDQAVLDSRTFFHSAWLIPIAIWFTDLAVKKLDSLVLGYGLFRMASDVEKLPFPMATMQASGMLAITEDATDKHGWRWRCFSIGACMGMVFGLIYIGVPTITSTLMDTPFQILPIPWLDTSVETQDLFPATATGICFDLNFFFMGMALPFFAVVGSFIGLIVTLILNPYLYQWGILSTWQRGEKTVQIIFENNIDFYLSFGIGLALAIFVLGLLQIIRHFRQRAGSRLDPETDTTYQARGSVVQGVARGDIKTWTVIGIYLASSTFYILLAGFLLNWDFKGSHFFYVLLFFAFVYIPLISYATARLEGLAGQVITLPLIREVAFILSGYQGIEIWLLPIPLTANYGAMDTVNYRVAELVGCSFRSIWKMTAMTLPLVFLFSVLYGNFIWGLAPIPSDNYPFAQEMWDLHARNNVLKFTATTAGYSPFMGALHWEYITIGLGAGLVTYFGLAFFGLPVLLLYGTVKGLGQSIPQHVLIQFCGAMFGRLVMEKKFGRQRWKQYALVLFPGFTCGMGLVMMASTGVKFLQSAIFQAPY